MDHGRVKHLACASCHEAKNPHRDQFTGRGCDQCHGTESYRIARFDHNKARFALDAAHAQAACSACHNAESDARGASFIRYRPLRTACKDCHGASS
jgi:Zn finger protein HypA/HybF involved in hydrogenase expression